MESVKFHRPRLRLATVVKSPMATALATNISDIPIVMGTSDIDYQINRFDAF